MPVSAVAALPGPPRRTALPIGILLISVSCFQLGGGLSKQLFPLVGPLGAAALRMVLSALILSAIARPWQAQLAPGMLKYLVAYGMAVAGLNVFYFLALQRLPIGIAVAINFIGPLSVSIAYSRRWIDGLWVGLAVVGIGLLLPLGGPATRLDPLGMGLSFLAAAAWALYIVCGKRIGQTLPGGQTTALGLSVAAVVLLPFGIAQAGTSLVSLAVLPMALLIAALSSALPFRLEMFALQRLPTRVFGVLMSLEPALGALFGWLILGETLTGRQDVAIGCIILASVGSTLGASTRR